MGAPRAPSTPRQRPAAGAAPDRATFAAMRLLPRRLHTVGAPAALVLVLAGCDRAAVRVLAARELGPLETTGAVKARDGGYSVAFGGRSAWLYGDSVLSVVGEDGSAWRDNTWSWTEDLDAVDGLDGFTEAVDDLGAPLPFFPATADEAAYNDAHRDVDRDGDGVSDCEDPCGGREALWPMDAVALGDTADGGAAADVADDEVGAAAGALVFYVKIHGEPGEWNFYNRGVGVAAWADPTTPPTRPEPGVLPEEPTLLFTPEEGGFGAAAALGEDGLLYAWGSREDEGAKHMRLGRVAPAAVQDRAAWRFWDGAGWTAEVAEAAPLFAGSSQLKVSRDEQLGTWLAFYLDEPWNELVLRTAPAPEGPWSDPTHVADVLGPPDGGWAYCGIDHPEYRRDGVHLVSYYRGLGDWQGETRLLEVALERR